MLISKKITLSIIFLKMNNDPNLLGNQSFSGDPLTNTWSSIERNTFVFNYPPRKNTITDMFVRYVVRRQRRGLPATKKDFYKTVLGYKYQMEILPIDEINSIMIQLNEPPIETDGIPLDVVTDYIKTHYKNIYYNPSLNKVININGHNSLFFKSITEAGILQRKSKFYMLGVNYNDWIKGNLKRR